MPQQTDRHTHTKHHTGDNNSILLLQCTPCDAFTLELSNDYIFHCVNACVIYSNRVNVVINVSICQDYCRTDAL